MGRIKNENNGGIKTIKEEKKYKLTDEKMEIHTRGQILYRIKALTSFSDVKKGELGGFVSSEHALSHSGDCWIYDKAMVCGSAMIIHNAKAYDSAQIWENAIMSDNAEAFDNVLITGKSKISDNAKIYGDSIICDNAKIRGNSEVRGSVGVLGYATVEDSYISGSACIGGASILAERCKVSGDVTIKGESDIRGNARISGKIEINSAYIRGNAHIKGDFDITPRTVVTGGKWSIPPLVIHGTRDILNVCSPVEIRVGGLYHSPEEWENNFDEIIEVYNYSKKQAKEYKMLVGVAIDWLRKYQISGE